MYVQIAKTGVRVCKVQTLEQPSRNEVGENGEKGQTTPSQVPAAHRSIMNDLGHETGAQQLGGALVAGQSGTKCQFTS